MEIGHSFKCLFGLFISLYINGNVEGQWNDMSKLLRELRIDYEKHVPPTRLRDSHVTVSVYPTILRINDVDVEKEAMSATISLLMNWSDERLSWNPSNHGGVQHVHIPADQAWVPDIVVHNNVDPSLPVEGSSQMLEVSNLGQVTMVSVFNVKTYCHVNLTHFPRDTHECQIVMGSWIHSAKTLLIEFWQGNEGVVKIPIFSDTDEALPARDGRTWQLLGRTGTAEIKPVTYSCCPDDVSLQLVLSVTLKRHAPFMTYVVYLPLLVFPLLLPLLFFIPPSHSFRHLYGLLIVCFEIMFFQNLQSYVPESADIPLLGKLLVVDMVCSSLAVVLSIIITNIADTDRNRRPLPHILEKLIHTSSCCHGPDIQKLPESQNLIQQNNTNEPISVEMNHVHNGDVIQRLQNSIVELRETICKLYEEKQHQYLIRQQWSSVARCLDKMFGCLFFIIFIVNVLLLLI